MAISGGEYCDKCKRRNPIAFHVEPEEAWKTVVLNRWRKVCPSCFDVLAEQAGVSYRSAPACEGCTKPTTAASMTVH